MADLILDRYTELSHRLTELAAPWTAKYGVSKLANHLSTVLVSLAFFSSLQILSRIISPIFFPNSYKKLKPITKKSWDVHFVAFWHAVIITPLAAIQWYKVTTGSDKQPLRIDRTYGYDPEVGHVYAITLGYFIWDAWVSILYDGPGFIAHGLVAMTAFVLAYRPVFMYDGLAFLLWELSTPFLNIHWFLDKLGKTGSTLQLINAFFLLSTYVFARLTFGMYNSYHFFAHVLFPPTPHVPPLPAHVKYFYLIGNITLNSLNFFWFRAMIRAIQKRFNAVPEADHDGVLDYKEVVKGKQKVALKVEKKSNFDQEVAAGVARKPKAE
ncbi:hypothetical protein OC846_006682 [Tilletia horrida]|uniref:TLC domain-containing protein n=1 Tax=Tilletia horrida TaxID=155126 RepID=A0AAN6GIE9_9BASI|nr:hypothetical protein OC845_006694 [Tilletia horrida]KAK0542616.1 hypothetical protein OC846_006682 [Tilletia horrida]KAK0560161.1 hypothetical protein OC861_006379 [Tilletia horrida]